MPEPTAIVEERVFALQLAEADAREGCPDCVDAVLARLVEAPSRRHRLLTVLILAAATAIVCWAIGAGFGRSQPPDPDPAPQPHLSGSLTGSVVFPNDAVATDVEVVAWRPRDGKVFTVRTDAAGNFDFGKLPAGNYAVWARAKDWFGVRRAPTEGHDRPPAGRTRNITVTPDQTRTLRLETR